MLEWLPLLRRTGSRVGRLSGRGFQALEHRFPGSVAVAHRLDCSMVCGSSRIRDQTVSPASAGGSLPLNQQGSPVVSYQIDSLVAPSRQ